MHGALGGSANPLMDQCWPQDRSLSEEVWGPRCVTTKDSRWPESWRLAALLICMLLVR